ncbi:MAG: hypothetical protein [Bacteriophage sp.]|nr:MAG: hypothetical protein [Bacteriophage sp.]
MITGIFELKENSDSAVHKVAEYTVSPKQALVDYIKQDIYKDYCTWTYPELIKGMRESDIVSDHWFYDDFKGRRVISACPL